MRCGARNFRAGLAAEDMVAETYRRRGGRISGRRWRGRGGEIDLVVEWPDGIAFVEVKKARSIEAAAQRIGVGQQHRIRAAAAEYLAGLPTGQETPARFDAALVGGDGRMEIIENAF